MSDEKQAGNVSIQDARIVQVSVMNDQFILVNFSDGSSALVPSEEIRKLVADPGVRVVRDDEVSD